MFKIFKNPFDYLSARPVRFFLAAALLWMLIMCILNALNGIQWNDILVEANGMAFDLFVFGVLLSLYEALRDKKDKIERLHEEIDDFRGWEDKEAMYRIVGAVRRLNKLGESEVKLSSCHLQKANFQEINLKKSNFSGTNLTEANFLDAELMYTSFFCAELQKSIFVKANMQWANFGFANLQESNIQEANLKGAYLGNAILQKVNLNNANLEGADLNQAKMQNAQLNNTNLKGANLQGAFLTDAILSGSNLQDSILVGADLIGSKLDGTTLDRADLLGAYVGIGWFKKLEAWKVIGNEKIIKKYKINMHGIVELNK